MPGDYLYLFLRKSISLVHLLFIYFLILSYMSFLYILDINPLLDIPFASNLCYSVHSLSILLKVSFAVLKLFSLLSHMFIFAFVSLACGERYKYWRLVSQIMLHIIRNFSPFSLVRPARDLSVSLTFSKTSFWFHWFFSAVFLLLVSLISVLIFKFLFLSLLIFKLFFFNI